MSVDKIADMILSELERAMNECNCNTEELAPYWHSDSCPVQASACEYCAGKGYFIVVLGCECCSDTERCDDCSGTGLKTEIK